VQDIYEDILRLAAGKIRQRIRAGDYASHTAGLGKGKLQANIAVMPERYALDFMRFCQRNPKPCPLVGVSDSGNPNMFTLGQDVDIRTDVPSYFLYEHGTFSREIHDITTLWQSDFVAFALGCSFTFEHALMRAGFSLWHIENDKTVPMFRSNIETVAAGPFSGPMVVSMRAINKSRIQEVIAISRKFPLAHGAPVHWGDPSEIGIKNIDTPDWGDASPVTDDQVPVFWACGVTPQVAIEQARLPICITHKPGYMLITDVDDDAEIPVIAHSNS